MVGLSVSFCIRDMVSGKVDPAVVEKIVAGTKASTPEEVEALIKGYRQTYWDECPDGAEQVFRQMLAEGKIVQPRVDGKPAPMIAGGHWVENESQIVYCNR